MPIASILAFWLVAVLLIVVPGADWAFTISSAVRGHTVVAAVGGLVAGYAAMTVVVAGGVGALVARAPAALSVLTFAGGGYLIWHGMTTMAHPSSPGDPSGPVAQTSNWATLVQGIGVSGLNPKALLLFLALLPQFTDSGRRWPLAVQIGVLGAVFTVTCAVFYLVLGSFAATVLRSRPAAAQAVGRLAGCGMFLIGAGLIAEHLIG
jgi:threonine/homoserine/homoserine lactone efflux protein